MTEGRHIATSIPALKGGDIQYQCYKCGKTYKFEDWQIHWFWHRLKDAP